MKTKMLFLASITVAIGTMFIVASTSNHLSIKEKIFSIVLAEDDQEHDENDGPGYPEGCYWGMIQCDDGGPDMACRIGTNGDFCRIYKCIRCD